MVTPFAFILLLIGLRAREHNILTIFLACCLFGATATLSFGGAPVLPAMFMVPFLLWRALHDRPAHLLGQSLRVSDPGFWLILLVLYGALSAYLLPRLFSGDTAVFVANRTTAYATSVRKVPLQPFSTNVTQTIYLLAGLAIFLGVRLVLSHRLGMRRLAHAVIVLGWLNMVAVALNLGERYLHLPSLLSYVRNASYAIFVDDTVAGLARISGTFPETSGWSAFSLPLFVFLTSLAFANIERRQTSALAVLTFLALVFSTSSTAYVSLAVIAVAAVLGFLWAHVTRRLSGEVSLMPLVLVLLVGAAACLVVLFLPELIDRISAMLDQMVWHKLRTESGIERSSWTAQAWLNFKQTHFLGAGLGSARSSSYPVTVLANVGIPGAVMLAMFLRRMHAPVAVALTGVDEAVRQAAKRALWTALLGLTVSGSVMDTGPMFYVYAAGVAGPFLGGLAARQRWSRPIGSWQVAS